MAYRFLHSADIHLDSPLRSLAMRNPALASVVGLASRRAFERLVEICLEERVNALVLAGDLYDGDQTSMKTARFLAGHIRRLHDAGIQVFIIRGNHDAMSGITKELVFPESVKVFGQDAEAVTVGVAPGHFPVVVHGLSFAKPHAPQGLLRHYQAPVAGAVNIGIMHTSLGGAEGHDVYAPCSLQDLHSSGFTYWALGHIHKRSVADGSATVVMPGIPQGRDINEDGPKSATLVTIGDDRSITVEEKLTSVAQFGRLTVDVSAAEDWRGLVEMVSGALSAKKDETPSEHLVARLRLVGTTPLTWNMVRDADVLKTDLDERGEAYGNTWIEKLEIQCQAPTAAHSGAADAISELARLITVDVVENDAFMLEFRAAAEELRSQLPIDLRHSFGSDPASFERILEEVKHEGARTAVARLLATGN